MQTMQKHFDAYVSGAERRKKKKQCEDAAQKGKCKNQFESLMGLLFWNKKFGDPGEVYPAPPYPLPSGPGELLYSLQEFATFEATYLLCVTIDRL